ncbi:aldo/keto reductase [Vulcanimicrobium alpinum]|uniref:Aldo/keto reductase n=1 Tax=Vulcanimicrobium alpinum TaxID=3016050 RepID=A0AAN1XVL5_UNVUL|nr:aldo/keto reductase [Vulcanimicrobium alpinum]BDE06245.1 aldo/keto reductase [Vulcanimicrobium alpinum]
MIERPFGPLERTVPIVGQGTWNTPTRGDRADEAKRALRRGVELGMVHIDTAEMYGDGASERLIGEAIRGLPREQLFLVSKVLPSNASYEGTLRACDASLKRLGTDYLDCYLLHWRGGVPLGETMRALERLVHDGKIRSLGVSNFDVDDLQEARTALERDPIACNQVLYHLGERTIEAHEIPYCREHQIAVVAYTPFGRGDWTDRAGVQTLERIARAHGATTRQVILAFLTRADGIFAIPKASTVAHVEENAGAGDVQLDDEEIRAIDGAFPARRRRGGLPSL